MTSRASIFSPHTGAAPTVIPILLLPVTLRSLADSRVVPKLQSTSPYPPRSAWQSASVAVVATRDCIFHYVSDSRPQTQLNASRDLILFLQRYPTQKTFTFISDHKNLLFQKPFTFIISSQCQFTFHISPLSFLRHEKASSNIVPISGASRQFDRLMDSFASTDPQNATESDGTDSPDAGAKCEVAPPAAVTKLELPARAAESAFEALRSSGVGDVWVPPLTSRGRPSPTQPSQADTGVARRSAARDSDGDDDSGSSVEENVPDGDVAMLVQHPSLEILESFDTDDLWDSRLFWLVPLAPVQGAPSDTACAHHPHPYLCGLISFDLL